jgi:c-di-GMP-binding flagellar brake protein YcgR
VNLLKRGGAVELDQSKVRIGTMMQIQPEGPNEPKYSVHLIGFLKRKGICVTQPTAKGEMAMLRDGQNLEVRFFSGKFAYAFDCVALRQTLIPYPMLHLSYPKSVRMHQVRAKPRLNLDMIALALNSERELKESIKISDLSTLGASLVTPADLGVVGDVLSLNFKVTVEGVEKLLDLKCQIRNVVMPVEKVEDEKPKKVSNVLPKWHDKEKEEKLITYGVSFDNVSPAMMISLSGYVANATLDQM